ncbi:hypothetical protein M2158_008894 [Streptomyces sp. SAI-144]|uniref:hypothetical protein n=1 Tax=Streptomyces sp. SAI-144 TaxID=2940544 RepID=UPI0024761B15|nr:hypothetical protein [Streptomyces sp. SAI-144]MDH6440353.1 hypothetical protein [Streptomyces sp. SAI-144]
MFADQHEDPFEERLAAALHETGGGFDTDRTALAARGEAHGRRTRFVRRAAVAGGTAGVVLACVGGALVLRPGGTATEAVPSSVTASAKPKPSITARLATDEEMIETLKSLLPKGDFSKERGTGTEPTDARKVPAPSAGLVFDDGKGAAAIGVTVGRVQPGGTTARQAARCPDRLAIPYDACNTSRLADGSVVTVLQGYEYPDRRVADTKLWTAELVTPTGQHITVSEWNAAAEKDKPVTRTDPPLNPAQLTRLAAAQEWRTVANALPEPLPEPELPGSDLHARTDLLALLALLPKGLKVTAKSSDDGDFAYAVVDDGKGRSMVQVNVQPDMLDVAGDLFDSSSETLPDGTRVAVQQGPGDRGDQVMWTVDTMRADGRRVVISAFNAGTQNEPATRATPALTIAQMREMALDARWWSGS